MIQVVEFHRESVVPARAAPPAPVSIAVGGAKSMVNAPIDARSSVLQDGLITVTVDCSAFKVIRRRVPSSHTTRPKGSSLREKAWHA